ncbi:MAG: HAD family phosphatase [bacterium]|nr:MAG: HAD family phosphatase [bacterium]
MIKHFIFDLGQVLVKVDLESFIYQFANEFKIEPIALQNSQNDSAHLDFQIGKINGETFHQITYKRFNHFVPLDRFKEIWTSMLVGEVDGTADLVNKLHEKRYALSLLSNTDPWHFEYCERNLPVLQKFDRKFLSYELKMKKPDAEIFLAIVKALGTKAEHCLFIDDSEKNVASAKRLNFQTIHFQNARQLRQELEELGIIL